MRTKWQPGSQHALGWPPRGRWGRGGAQPQRMHQGGGGAHTGRTLEIWGGLRRYGGDMGRYAPEERWLLFPIDALLLAQHAQHLPRTGALQPLVREMRLLWKSSGQAAVPVHT